MNEQPDPRLLVVARRLQWLAWIVVALLVGLWLWSGGGSVYDRKLWFVYKCGKGALWGLIFVVLGRAWKSCDRAARKRVVARLGLVAGAGVVAFWLLNQADSLMLGLVERQVHPPEWRLCSFVPAVAPAMVYMGVFWLPVVLRMQAEACELLARSDFAPSSWLRRRLLGLAVGLWPVVAVTELLMFVLAHNYRAEFEWAAFACVPVLALSMYELWLRRQRQLGPLLRRGRGRPSSSCAAAPLPDPVALRRGRVATRVAWSIAALTLSAGAYAAREVGLRSLLDPPESLVWLAIGLVAISITLVLTGVARPGVLVQRPADESDGLTPGLRLLLGRLERFGARLERARESALWKPAHALVDELAALGESERGLLEARHADLDSLDRALRRVSPFVVDQSTAITRRRIAYRELVRFCRRARGQVGVDPYRGGRRDADRHAWLADDTREPLPVWWFVAALPGACAWLWAAHDYDSAALLTATLVGPLAYAIARAVARRMYALAWPASASNDATPGYSPEFSRTLERVTIVGASVRGLATATAIVLAVMIPLVSVEPGLKIGRWSFEHPGKYVVDLLPFTLLAGVGLLALPLVRARICERAELAWLHSRRPAGVRELVALRLAWAARLDPGVELLEGAAELLRSLPELGALAPEDRELLIDRVERASRGGVQTRAQRRALTLELRSAERLLARRST